MNRRRLKSRRCGLWSAVVCVEAIACMLVQDGRAQDRGGPPPPPPSVLGGLHHAKVVPGGSLRRFRDRPTGVSFRYPSGFTLSRDGGSHPPLILRTLPKPAQAQAVVQFNPAGNFYAQTNLAALTFAFVSLATSSATDCAAKAMESANAGPGPEEPVSLFPVRIDRRAGRQISGQQEEMCGTVEYTIYATEKKGVCSLFEADFRRACLGVAPGTRGLRDGEIGLLEQHLDAIIQTVTFSRDKR